MTEGGALSFQYGSDKLENLKYPSYSVLRSKFDKWLADKAEEAGVMLTEGFLVDELVVEDGKVVGVMTGGEEFDADVVILADGVNSLLAQQIGMKQELEQKDVAVGVKEVIELGEDVINERFGLTGNDGAAWMMAGDPTGGNLGGGFIYTNKDSLSLGIVTTISDIGRVDVSVPDMVERMKAHPAIAPFLKGGKLKEYSAHLVTEGGLKMMPELVRDGVLVAGDAAAMVVNLGYTVRGMDLAIESGRLAGEAVIKAKNRNDFSAESLSIYKTLLEESFIMKLMKQYQNLPGLLEDHIIFNDFPKMAEETIAAAGGKPMMIIFNKIDAYTYIEKAEDDLTPRTKANWSLEELMRTWMAKMEDNCLFISAREKTNLEQLKEVVYQRVKELHVQKYPYNDFLYQQYEES